MKYLILLLISLNSFATTATLNNSVQVGGAKNSNNPSIILPSSSSLSSVRTLSAEILPTGTNTYYTLYNWGPGGGQYQVTTGKTLYCNSLMAWCGAGGNRITFGNSTATFSNGTGTTPTGAVWYGISPSVSNQGSFTCDGASVWQQHPIMISFPSNTYPFILSVDGSVNWNVILECVEI